MRTIPKSFEVNECTICNRRFTTKGGLTFHIRIKRHYDMGPALVKCTKCVKQKNQLLDYQKDLKAKEIEYQEKIRKIKDMEEEMSLLKQSA